MAKQDVAARIEDLLNEYLTGKELEIYNIEYKKEGKDWKLRVYLDKPIDCDTEYVDINECEDVTRFLSDKLDEEDFIERSYTLEVSSPGLDRELIKPSDFDRFRGREVEVKLYKSINGRKEFTGTLIGKSADEVTIETDERKVGIPAEQISKINLAVIFLEDTMNKDFLDALTDVELEKNISKEDIITAIEDAVELAYKKNYGNYPNVRVLVDREDGEVLVLMSKEVVSEVEDDMMEVSLEEARSYDERYEVGDVIEYQVDPKDFGRIAAQTAKQVVVQRIREAERRNSYDEFVNKQGEIVTAKIERINNGTMFLSVGNSEGILPLSEQVKTESFNVGDRIKVYVIDVKKATKGPQIFLSRSHPGLVRRLFELEVPEIADGTVEIKGIAREAGSRTKIAVYSHDENVDPVGACVGNRGTRVQNIVDELFGEKIDIIVWDEDPAVLISNVLKPAEVEGVYINYVSEKEKMATAVVPEQQLSLAIGREGQNVRLAARVSGWKIDIKSKSQLEDSGFDFDEYEDQDGQAADGLIDEDVPTDAPLDPEAAEVDNDVDAEA